MSTTKKMTKEERIVRSLTTAAKTLNKVIHKTTEMANIAALNEAAVIPLVRVFQVFCPDQNAVISSPTTDEDAAREFRDDHNLTTGHNSRILVSN